MAESGEIASSSSNGIVVSSSSSRNTSSTSISSCCTTDADCAAAAMARVSSSSEIADLDKNSAGSIAEAIAAHNAACQALGAKSSNSEVGSSGLVNGVVNNSQDVGNAAGSSGNSLVNGVVSGQGAKEAAVFGTFQVLKNAGIGKDGLAGKDGKEGGKDAVVPVPNSGSIGVPAGFAPQNSALAAPSSTPPTVQRQPHIPPPQQRVNTPFICVPNQQAPYPHVQSQPQMRANKGMVVRHMTSGPTAQRTLPQKFPQRPNLTVFPQGQMASSSQTLRQPHPTQKIAARPPHMAGRQYHPVQKVQPSPRGVMSASASPQPHLQKPQGAQQLKPGQTQPNGSAYGKAVPPWLPSMPPGVANALNPNDPQMRDRGTDVLTVICNDRKVRLVSEEDKSSLYSLCRRWVRNDVLRKDQVSFWDYPIRLPKPLPASEVEKSEPSDEADEEEQEIDPQNVDEEELLEHHINHFKNVRKRAREERKESLARYRTRLQLLLPPM